MAEESESAAATSSSSISNDSNNLKHQPQVPAGFPSFPNGDIQMLPIMYPALIPGLLPQQTQEHTNRGGAGIYAVPTNPFMGPVTGFPSNTLIPLTYSIPTRTATEGGAGSEVDGQEGRQPHAAQRQVVVRRFHFAFQLDLLLILKLAAVIFVFNQDGSKQRLLLLLLFASIVYLYQTGALTPLIRWLSQGMMHRAAAPPRPQPPVRAENVLAGGGGAPEGVNAARAEGEAGGENTNQAENENRGGENENQGGGNGMNWRVIVKEIQMIVVGFITSLLPGFHNVD